MPGFILYGLILFGIVVAIRTFWPLALFLAVVGGLVWLCQFAYEIWQPWYTIIVVGAVAAVMVVFKSPRRSQPPSDSGRLG